MWWIKLIVLVLMVAAVVALFRALMALVRGDSGQRKTMHALAWRVGFSVAVFVFLAFSAWMGWIQPHGVQPAGGPGAGADEQAAPARPHED